MYKFYTRPDKMRYSACTYIRIITSPYLVGLPAGGAPAVPRQPLDRHGERLAVGHGQIGGGVGRRPLDEQLRPRHDGRNVVGHDALVDAVVGLAEGVEGQLAVVRVVAVARKAAAVDLKNKA